MNKFEEFEKIALLILASTLLFSFFTLPYILIIFSAIIAIFFWIIKVKSNYYLLLFFIPPLLNPLCNYTKEINYNEIYKFHVAVNNQKIKVEKVGYRNLGENYYIDLGEKTYENGRYIVEYRVEEISNYYNSKSLSGSIINIKVSFFDNIAKGIRKKVEDLNFDIDLETFTMGVVLGDKSRISEELNNLFRETSTSHLLAISGLHMGIVLGFLLGLFSLFPLKFQMKYLLTLVILSIYVMIIGFSPSVQRAYIMSFIFLLSKIFFDKSDSKKSLCIAFVISLSLNMSLVKDIAFQMSYLALYSILYIYKEGENKVLNMIKMSFFIQLCLSPIFIFYFGTLPLGTFVTNIFAVFWGSILILLVYLNIFLEIFHLGFLLKSFTQFFFDVLMVFLKVAEKIPYMTLEIMREIPQYIYVISILMIIVYPFVKKKEKFLIYLSIIPLYFTFSYKIIDKEEFIYFPKERVYIIKDKISYITGENEYESKYILARKGEVEGVIGIEDGETIDFGTLEISRIGRNFVYTKK